MDVQLAEEPFRPGQVTYQRKAAAAEGRAAAEVAPSSSSPAHFPGSSSPTIRPGETMGDRRERSASCNTTISSQGEHDMEEEEEEELAVKSHRRGGTKKAALFLSDEDEEEAAPLDDDAGDKIESDADFLKRFRASRADRAAVLAQQSSSNPEMASSSSLSDPPTLSNPSQQARPTDTSISGYGAMQINSTAEERDTSHWSPSSSSGDREVDVAAARLPHSLESTSQSPTPSPYVTEAQKRLAEDNKRLSREAKVKELASRKAKLNDFSSAIEELAPSRTNANKDDDDDDVVESSSSDDGEETLPSAIKAARMASDKRRRADEKKVAKQMASRKANGNTSGVLEMRVDDESDSDLDMPARDSAKGKARAMKPLSKKEEEEMHRMQAKIERESKVRQAKSIRKKQPGESRPTFGLSDLLSNIDKHEKANGAQGRQHETEEAIQEANNSDPIESSSDGELDRIDTGFKGSTRVARRADRFSAPPVRPLSPSPPRDGVDQAGEDDDLPDAADTLKAALEERRRKSRMDAFKEKKMQALLKSIANQGKGVIQDDDDEDDLVLERNVPGKAMIQPKAHDRRQGHNINRMGSPLSFSDEGGSEDDLVSDAQLKRAGKPLHAPVESVAKAAKAERTVKRKAKDLTAEELNIELKRRVQLQNIEMRRKRETAFGRRKESQKPPVEESPKEDVADMLRKLREAHERRADHGDDKEVDSEGEGSEYKPDDVAEEDAGEEEIGSAQEEEEEEEVEEEDGRKSEEASSEAGSDDSEKENSMPPSQEGVQPRMPRRSRIIMDEDDQESSAMESVVGRSPLQPISVVHEESVQDSKGGDGEESVASPLMMDSSGAGFSQFFAETQVPAGAPAPSTRKISSTLGKFFEDSQPGLPLRGESFHVLPSDDESGSMGFSQFFNEGTQQPATRDTARLMLPPNTSAKGLSLRGGTDEDGFAALRKAQANDAGVLESEVGGLPSLDQAAGLGKEEVEALEMEALEAEAELRREQLKESQTGEADITYINKDGFFTQTRPDFDRYSLSQSQSQDRMERSSMDKYNVQGSSLGIDESMPNSESGAAKKKRRFRRAVSVDEEEPPREEEETAEAEDVADKGGASVDEAEEEEEDGEGEALPNAFDVMKAATKRPETAIDRDANAHGQKRSRFIQGEAEESDEEEEGPAGKKRKDGRGGLGGVFSDDESDNEGDEEEDSDDDGRDLEELIDEEKDEEEAEKDVLARERYLKDIEADDQAALALHEKATRGGLRSKRRAVNLDGTMEGFLDDDFEDEWLEKKVKNPYGFVPKKRRLQGLDGLDLLEANEESQAFVRKYRETHEKETNLDKYGFLMPEEDEQDGDQETAGDNEGGPGASRDRQNGMHLDDDSDEDDGEREQVQTMSHQQLKQELEERRRRRKRQALEDEEDMREEEHLRELEKAQEAEMAQLQAEEEARLMRKLERDIYGHSSDEDDDENETSATVRDRIRGQAQSKGIAVGGAKAAVGEDDEEEEEDGESTFSALNRIANVRTLSELERQRLARLQSEFANEPEWGNHDANQHVSYKRNSSSSGGSITSFKASKGVSSKSSNSNLNASSKPVTSNQQQLRRVRSKLSDVMSRKGQFSEVQDT